LDDRDTVAYMFWFAGESSFVRIDQSFAGESPRRRSG
jgi:hypothetical protein